MFSTLSMAWAWASSSSSMRGPDASGNAPTPGDPASLGDTTFAALISAFAINGALALLFIVGFIILRPRFPHTYAPRVHSVPEKQRSPELPKTLLGFLQVFQTSDLSLLQRLGPDAFGSILFTRTMAILFVGLSVLSCVILIPVHVYGGNGLRGLDAFTLANVTSPALLWVHLVLMYLVTGTTIHTIYRLIAVSARLRQHYLSSTERARTITSRTLMVRDVTPELRNPLLLARLYDRINPGSVHAVVIPRQVSTILSALVLNRKARQGQLEGALTKYIQASAEEARLGRRPVGTSLSFEDAVESAKASGQMAEVRNRGLDLERNIGTNKSRPMKRKFLCFGEPEDAITHYAEKIKNLEDRIDLIREARGILDTSEILASPPPPELSEDPTVIQQSHAHHVDITDAKFMPVAFVFFKDILSAHIAAASVPHDAPAALSEMYACIDEKNIIWDNVQTSFLERQTRSSLANTAFIALLIFWSAFIGFIRSFAQPEELVKIFPALKGFFDYSPELTGVISGFLPQAIISTLLLLVPFILRFLNTISGLPLVTEVERVTHDQFFFFLVFNLFFATTLSGTLLSVWSVIEIILKDPTSIFYQLAEIIPKSANFFTNYVMLAGLSGPTADLLQLAPLIASPILVYLFGSTPRLIHAVMQPLPFRYSEIIPYHSFFAVLGLIYITIAPLVVVMVSLYFGFYFFVYLYQLQYVYVHPQESGGRLLFTASQHIFTGLYIMQILMIGLFGLRQAYIQAALALVLLGFTGWCTHQSNKFKRLAEELPVKTVLDAEDAEALGSSTEPIYNPRPSILSRFLPGFLDAIEMPEELQSLTCSGRIRERSRPEPFAFPSNEELVATYAHPSAGAAPVKIWVPAPSVESVAESIKYDVAVIPSAVLVTEGAAVDAEGRVKLSPGAVAWTDV
ncbi:hypothetical protein HDU96_009483 [Phlyctochytrium bullatum]|nr:hypothetical protein HDU96_009483 [Phlyctochytrium bullatum]